MPSESAQRAVLTEPADSYKNAVVLYTWRQCGHCKQFAPTFADMIQTLPPSTKVYAIDVFDHKAKLQAQGLDLGRGVPKLLVFNGVGEEYAHAGPRDLETVNTTTRLNLLSTSPEDVAQRLPAFVLYFRHTCGYCVRFAPTFVQLPGTVAGVDVMAVDIEKYPEALSNLEPQAGSTGVPHMVYHPSSGPQVPYEDQREVALIQKFVNDQQAVVALEGGGARRAVSFSEKHRTDARRRLGEALDELQHVAGDELGDTFRDLFEPKESSVCYVGWCCKGDLSKDRVYVMIIPKGDRPLEDDGTLPVFAVLYGARLHGVITPRVYHNKNPEQLLRRKYNAGFRKARQTDVYVQELREFGYRVRVDVGNTVCIFD
jgi:thiol-disulfide isomerase/thioredoxin